MDKEKFLSLINDIVYGEYRQDRAGRLLPSEAKRQLKAIAVISRELGLDVRPVDIAAAISTWDMTADQATELFPKRF